ncbi:uncharacterized protein LOC21406995 [Morus notabilis]|uniref:uncharacterized protein LOC21406995 n=1 Tax=Morus notabilis TaxID=981085 RepID=UPI000CED61C9|nr:uncharacterized protein LOC21406995 [Morus notabilis]XP_024031508.1 uncharacterized protein LOC21406995 [Morus notabilis]
MLESELCSSRVVSPLREESGDEELSVLPRHTKVIVTGNNRTKSVLVGLQGVVKKAVGLGGWHWLVLKNGVEVKLQRNALSVLEHPTGNEEDDFDYDNSSTSSEIGDKDNDFCSSTEFHKHSRPRVRHVKSSILSTSAKSINRGGGYKEVQSIHTSRSNVNFARLGTDSLRRYCRYFNLASSHSNPSREHMINMVQRHFYSHQKPLDDMPVITEFVRAAAKRRKTGDFPEKHREREL